MSPVVFVYGTLTDPDRVAAVLDEWTFRGPATLDGLRRVEGTYPTLAPGGRTEGRLLATPDLDRLDEYEGVDGGLYARVEVPVAADRGDAPDRVHCYVGDPGRLDAAATWPGDGPFGERVRRVVRDRGVVVRPG